MEYDYAFETATSNLRFGVGVTREIGMDLADLGVRHVILVTDPHLAELPPVLTVIDSLRQEEISYSLLDGVRIESTNTSMKEAIDFAQSESFDAFIGVGGRRFHGYSQGGKPLGHLSPGGFSGLRQPTHTERYACARAFEAIVGRPHHSRAGSEITGVAIFDLEAMHAREIWKPQRPWDRTPAGQGLRMPEKS